MTGILTLAGLPHSPMAFVAAIVCLVSCMTAFRLFGRGVAGGGEARPVWFMLTGIAAGFGIWSTHALALIAFDPGLDFGMMPAAVFLSLGIAVAMCTAAFLAAANLDRNLRAPVGGALFALGIGSMHYLWMAGFVTQGDVFTDTASGLIAIGLCAALAGAGFTLAGDAATVRRQAVGGLILALGVTALHFTALSGVDIAIDRARIVAPGLMNGMGLLVVVGATMTVVIATGLGAALVDAQASERAVVRLRRLANGAFDGIVIAADGRIVDANTAYADLVGIETADLIGRPVDAAVLGEAGETVLGAGGGDIPVEVRSRQLSDDGRESVLAVRDLRDRLAAEDRIRHLASHDSLTGLPNRAALHVRLENALEHAATGGWGVALLCIDIDHFKEVNDVHGHAAGDAVLIEVARRLTAAVSSPSCAARMGGDEFVVLYTGYTQTSDVAKLANALLDSLRRPVEVDGRLLPLGVSIGVSLHPDDASAGDDLLTNADIALYRAKSGGRNGSCFFRREMDDAVRLRRALAQDLREGIRADQLRLDYQPLTDLKTGEVVAFEALARWDHPERGLIQPEEFILIAEENGLIGLLGDWVLVRACAEAAAWPIPRRVAVNFSALQVHQEDLPHRVAEILIDSGLAPDRLEIEVTETALFRDQDRALHNLRRLKMLGVRVAMDDFGTGYSSLATLQAFPFDKIKIDKSFVEGVIDREQSSAIVRAIVGLGRSLNVPVTAEGVETQAQLDYLRDEGCTQAQGFLLGRPLPIAEQGRHVGLPEARAA